MTTIKARTSVVTLYQGDYLDRIRHIERQYEEALRSEVRSPRLLNEVPASVTLADEHATLVAEAEATAVNVTLRALGRKEWRALVAAHPPRDGNEDDKQVGVNEDSFKDPLILSSIVDPALTEDDLDMLSEADSDQLYLLCWALNRLPVDGPKALRVLPQNQPSDATSN